LVLIRWKKRRKILPPITKCSICKCSLYDKERYRVKLILREGPVKGTTFKVLHVCRSCLERLKNDNKINELFKIRYRKMPKLKSFF